MNIPLSRPSQQAHLHPLSPSHGQHNLFCFPYFFFPHPFPVLFIFPVFLHSCPSPVSPGPHFRPNEKEDRKDFSFLIKSLIWHLTICPRAAPCPGPQAAWSTPVPLADWGGLRFRCLAEVGSAVVKGLLPEGQSPPPPWASNLHKYKGTGDVGQASLLLHSLRHFSPSSF